MKRYSLDLRQKVVTADQLGNTARSADGPKNRRQLAEPFMLSPATVHSYIKQYRETQDITPKKAIQGSMKGKEFKDFIEHDLVPKLNPGVRSVMDHLKSHKMEGIEELIVATGARVEYLPPYSPDFNLIEMLWSTVKSLVRMFPTRAMSAREQLIELALMLIGTNTFKNWFTK
ncbi:MAG: transposase, partial [Hormoscilla sp. GM102CHS1]|nr:transposase [Hormoscilla sp. GM102CHS1]